MKLGPAEAFDNYIRENSEFVTCGGLRIPVFRGRQNLAELEGEDLKDLLITLRNSFNVGLTQHKRVAEHIDDLPLYLDFIDSDISNAVAFRDDSFAFIGITVPLIRELLELCASLSRSEPIQRILGLENTDEVRAHLNVVLFQHLLKATGTAISKDKRKCPGQPEMEKGRFPLVGKFRPSGGDFQGMGVYRSDVSF
jgi:hypothetical protein